SDSRKRPVSSPQFAVGSLVRSRGVRSSGWQSWSPQFWLAVGSSQKLAVPLWTSANSETANQTADLPTANQTADCKLPTADWRASAQYSPGERTNPHTG